MGFSEHSEPKPILDAFAKKTENAESTNYVHVVPNSHYWSDLNQLLMLIEHCPETLTPQYLNIGLINSKYRGYDIKQTKNLDLNQLKYTIFVSIDEMIKFVNEAYFNLFDLKATIQTTLDVGLDLTNGKKMERREIYKCIDCERDYQDKNWGSRRQMDGTPDEEKPVAEWINYIEFHIAKAKDKVYHLDTVGATAELRKVAALAVRAMEIHGCPERWTPIESETFIDEMFEAKSNDCTCDNCDCKKDDKPLN